MNLFNPSRDEVRNFFREAFRKSESGELSSALEILAASWANEHPEYHAMLRMDPTELPEFTPQYGQTNPFLHLAMHLSLSEQVSIDQPPGIRAAAERLTHKLNSLHQAQHVMMECLGQMLWTAQRDQRPPDAEAYLECIARHAR